MGWEYVIIMDFWQGYVMLQILDDIDSCQGQFLNMWVENIGTNKAFSNIVNEMLIMNLIL